MKKHKILILLVLMISITKINLFSQQIIANHTIVDKYKDIPPYYINKVKEMWVTLAGESHSSGYRIGCQLLAAIDTTFKVNITESGTPELYSNQYLRLSRATWGDVTNVTGWRYGYGEEDWYTTAAAKKRTQDHITYCNTHNLTIAAMGFGWCWDMTMTNNPGGTIDPVYQVRWGGSTNNGPQGNLRWGLDANDSILTGNSVCMDSYLNATTELINHCTKNGFPTKIFYTTGPVDGGGNTGENGYQRFLKHQYIRNYVTASPDRVLFDYSDILCWSNAGVQNTKNWTDYGAVPRTFQYIHDDNMLDLNGSYAEDGDHIGQRGTVRLAKAMWWMLARMAGWDGIKTDVKEINSSSNFSPIYPNPVHDKLIIQTRSTGKDCYLILSSMNGKVVLKKQIENYSTELDVKSLAKGMYHLSLVSDKKTEVRKIIKD